MPILNRILIIIFFRVLIIFTFGIFSCKTDSSSIYTSQDYLEITKPLFFDSVIVALYISDAGWADCKTHTIIMLDELEINYVEINRDDILQGCLKNYSVLFLPGGRPDFYYNDLGVEGLDLIKNYVQMGGGYIGICGTGYLAAETNIWRGWAGDPRVYQRYHSGLLGIFSGTADGPIEDFAPSYRDLVCEIEIQNNSHPMNSGLPDTVTYVYDHGPMFIIEDDTNDVILGRSVKGDNVIIMCTQYYDGNIFLSSGHPEFDDTKTTWLMISNAVEWCSKFN